MNLPEWMKMPFQKHGTEVRAQSDEVKRKLDREIERLKLSMIKAEARKKGVPDGSQ